MSIENKGGIIIVDNELYAISVLLNNKIYYFEPVYFDKYNSYNLYEGTYLVESLDCIKYYHNYEQVKELIMNIPFANPNFKNKPIFINKYEVVHKSSIDIINGINFRR